MKRFDASSWAARVWGGAVGPTISGPPEAFGLPPCPEPFEAGPPLEILAVDYETRTVTIGPARALEDDMGMIRIDTLGSFKASSKTFGAQSHGHAQAVAEAIEYLSREVLPAAIANDHECHNDGVAPAVGFGKVPNAPKAKTAGG